MPIATTRRYAARALDTAADADRTAPERPPRLEAHADHVTSTIELLHRQQQHLTEKIGCYRDLVRLGDLDPAGAGASPAG